MDNKKKYSTDPRFLGLSYGLRKNNRSTYAFSISASQELFHNDSLSAQYTKEMWDEFWRELVSEYYHSLGLDRLVDGV